MRKLVKSPTGAASLLAKVKERLSSASRERWYRTVVGYKRRVRTPGFFDVYPRFFTTSDTAAAPDRLNQRHRALIQANAMIIEGRQVLDIASHDGRWSFAAHKAGAKYVLGIEAREHLVEAARANIAAYGAPTSAVEFIQGDVFVELDLLQPGRFDTIFCFGFLYHTIDHMSVLRKIARLRPSRVIVDTWISSQPGCVIEVQDESIDHESQAAVPDPGTPTRALRGSLSKRALEMMLRAAGFTNLQYYDWRNAGIKRWDDLEAYYLGNRVTLTASDDR